MPKKKGTTVKTTKATPATPTRQAKPTKNAREQKIKAFRESFEKLYGVKPFLVQLMIHDCRDCPHLHDYGVISNKGMQQRRYGCLPLVLLKRAGEDIQDPFIEISGVNAKHAEHWKPHPMCPLGLGLDDA